MEYCSVCPVALNVTGFPLIPLGAAVAVTEFAPSCTVHDPTVAIPLALVLADADVRDPVPDAIANVTLTPDTGSPDTSFTITEGGKLTA
jgi:hypothetical protein